MTIEISVFSEDGASVYEARNPGGQLIGSLYIGNDDWRYGNRDEILAKIQAWEDKLNEKTQ